MINKFKDTSTYENYQNVRHLAECARYDLNENRDTYREVIQDRFGINLSKLDNKDKFSTIDPIYGADGAQITISPDFETYKEGVVSSVVIGGKTQDSKAFKPIENFKHLPSFYDETGELVKISMRDIEYFGISCFFQKFLGNVMADGSSVQLLYDIVKMLKSDIFFQSIENEEILQNILKHTLNGRLVYLPKLRKLCSPDNSSKCTSHIHLALEAFIPDIHLLHERQVLSPLMNEKEILNYPLNGISRHDQWKSSGFSNEKIISENASEKVASIFKTYSDMFKSNYQGVFVKFENNQHIQEIEYFCENNTNLFRILRSIEIEIRGNIPQPLPIYKADRISKENVKAQLIRIRAGRENKKNLKEFVFTRPVPMRS